MDVNLNSDQKIEKDEIVKTEKLNENAKQKLQDKKLIVRNSGIGIDCGTMNIISAISKNDEASFKVQRDAFFDIENNVMSKNMLDKLKANYIESNDKRSLYVVGDEALQMANVFNREIRRPLSKGVVSTREQEALSMIKTILYSVLGDPIIENEVCHFSVPARSLDVEDQNVIYHENMLKSFIASFGYKPIKLNEAFAITWAELDEEDFTGLTLSFGAGMVNACLSFMGISQDNHQFSVSRSGDWIDENAAMAVGMKISKITAIKESGMDLLNPEGREQTAIQIYYQSLIDYVCKALEQKLNSADDLPNFPDPITIVLSGGTSQIKNFDKVFEENIKSKKLPFQIKQVRKAKDQLNAVAKGCLLNSLNYYS